MLKIEEILDKEKKRQENTISLSAAENIVSERIMNILAHPIMNKTAEGYPGKRYHGGTTYLDEIELYAQELAMKIFGAKYANVQPHCATNANFAVIFSLLKPGEKLMSMNLSHGGHLSHGAKVSITGEIFNVVNYNVRPDTFLIDYDMVRDMALKEKPKLIIAGSSAYPRFIDFNIFREIADETGAYFLADVSHFAGLIAGGVYPNPIDIADFTTFSTYKTFPGPRGGIVLMGKRFDEKSLKFPKLTLSKAVDFTLFPGVQSAIFPNNLAAKAALFEEALEPKFKEYAQNVVMNAEALAQGFIDNGVFVLTGGTDTHQVVIDVSKLGWTGYNAQLALESCGIIQNRNMLPYDLKSAFVTSGLRFGTSASTSLGLNTNQHQILAGLISEILKSVVNNQSSAAKINQNLKNKVRTEISKMF